MKHPIPVGVLGLWDLHLPYQEKVGPQARLPSLRTTLLIGWILEELPSVGFAAIESIPDGYFEVWLQSAKSQHKLELKELQK